jgi:type II secretory pathway pseudopilin PulG
MRLAKDRGFSLLIVLVVLVVLAVIGVTTVTLGITEAGTAGARVNRRQALSAAEAGVNHFMGLTQPATPNADGFFIGNAGTGVDAWQWLPTVKGPRGETLQPRYQAVLAPTQPGIANSRLVDLNDLALTHRISLAVHPSCRNRYSTDTNFCTSFR